MGVGFAHQLVGLFGGGVERDGLIDAILDREGEFGVAAVDRGGGGVDHVLDASVAGNLQQVEVAREIGGEVGVGVGDGVAHARLRAQMDDAVEFQPVERGDEGGVVGEILPEEGEAVSALGREVGEAGFLQIDVVIVVHAIDADDGVAARQQAGGEAVADETGGAGDENFHGSANP